jgi:hypothetical protein
LEKSIPYYLARYEQQNMKQPAKSIMKDTKPNEPSAAEPSGRTHGEAISTAIGRQFYLPIDEINKEPPKQKAVEQKSKASAPPPQKPTPSAPNPKLKVITSFSLLSKYSNSLP